MTGIPAPIRLAIALASPALVVLPLAALRRLTWGAAVAAVLTALMVGELIFLGSQGTAFARWSAMARAFLASSLDPVPRP